MTPIAVYVHTPFCPSKCGYCDFNSYAMSGEIMERTTDATVQEILASPWRGRPAKTIFFGGGTPTYLPDGQLARILDAVREVHPPLPDCEITSEANPGTVDTPKFEGMVAAGFNRVSLGVQSFSTGDLMRLGRVHEAGDVGTAVVMARRAGFKSLNLDLMFGLPGQSVAAWRRNLDLALSLRPDHLSLYCLTIEPNTRFYRLNLKGMLHLPDEEAQIEMYDLAMSRCAEAGLIQYEISNFARPGFECRHNLCYWLAEDYAGYGPGAVGCVGGVRSTNQKHPERYISAVDGSLPLKCEEEALDEDAKRTERIMLGLRLNSGLDPAGLALAPKALARLRERGWIEEGDVIRLTPLGRRFCSEATVELL